MPAGGGLLEVLAPAVKSAAAAACASHGGAVAFSVAPASPASKSQPVAVAKGSFGWAVGLPKGGELPKSGVKVPFTVTADCLKTSGETASTLVIKGTKNGMVTLTIVSECYQG